MRRSAAGAATVCAFALLVLAPQVALAHPGHSHTTSVGWLPIGVFVVGISTLLGSVYADHRGLIDRRLADAGVFFGVLVGLTGGALIWV